MTQCNRTSCCCNGRTIRTNRHTVITSSIGTRTNRDTIFLRSHCTRTNSHRSFTARAGIRADGNSLFFFRTASTKSNCLTTRCISGIANCNCALRVRLANNRFFRNFSATNSNRTSTGRFSVNPCCQGFAACCTVIIIVIVSICTVYMVEVNTITTGSCNLFL